MNSIVLRTATKFLLALMLLFSVFVLFRGHNDPGGGFIAGLIAGSAFALYLMAHGPIKARQLLFFDLRHSLAFGMSCVVGSGLVAWVKGHSFLTGYWVTFNLIRLKITIGTPLLFDIGVFIVVVSSISLIIFALEEK